MPAVNCKYHPTTPARWECHHCHISFCPSCVTQKENQQVPDCPVCRRALDSLGSENLVTPFWLRLNAFFIYPTNPVPLTIILVLSLLAFLLWFVPGWDIDIKILFWSVPRNILIVLPLILIFTNYLQTVLKDTAQGYLKPRPIDLDRLFGNGLLVLQLLAILLSFKLLSLAALELFDLIGYHIVNSILLLVTPAALMVLAMEEKFFHALNPATLYSVIRRIGLSYFIMFVMFYVLDITQSYSLDLLFNYIETIPPIVSVVIYAFVTMYFYTIIFNLMGYTIYQHHDTLGYDIDVEMSDQEEGRQFDNVSVSPEMREVEILLHEGKSDQAIVQLRALITSNPGDLQARDRMLKLLRLHGDKEQHMEQAQKYISYLIGENRLGSAADVLSEGYKYDKSLKPAKPAERFDMAKYFRHKSNYRLAMAVLNDLHRDFPTFDRIPEAYLMVAELLSEHLNDDKRAAQILRFLINNYAAHPLIDEVKTYLQTIERISNQ